MLVLVVVDWGVGLVWLVVLVVVVDWRPGLVGVELVAVVDWRPGLVWGLVLEEEDEEEQ